MNRCKKIGEMFDLDAGSLFLLFFVILAKPEESAKLQPPFCISSQSDVVGPSNFDDRAALFTVSDYLLGAHIETSESPRCS